MKEPKDIKVGFVGCGSIAHFHADVIKYLGCNLTAVSYRSSLENARSFSKKYNIPSIYNSWAAMLERENLDSVWVVASWDEIDGLLMPILSFGVPVFFEKPVALSSNRIKAAIEHYPGMLDKVQIGYNRRFYPFIENLKELLYREKILAVELHISETLQGKDERIKEHILVQNSSHLFDLMYYLLQEPYSPANIFKLGSNRHDGYVGTLLSESGIPISFNATWDMPSNCRIKFYTYGKRVYDLCPIEMLSVYEGIDIVNPSENFPLRRYQPRRIQQEFALNDQNLKPGFIEQAAHFFDNVMNSSNLKAANLQSSLKICQIIEALNNKE